MRNAKNIKDAFLSLVHFSGFNFFANISLCVEAMRNSSKNQKTNWRAFTHCVDAFFYFKLHAKFFLHPTGAVIRETPAISMAGYFFTSNQFSK